MQKKQILLVLFLYSFFVYGQNFSVLWYGTESGLPQSSVKDIAKDKFGFLWLSTENGIVRYDGRNFLVYNKFKINNHRFKNFFGNVQKDTIAVGNAYEENVILIKGRKPIDATKSIKESATMKKNCFPYYKNNLLFELDPTKNYYISLQNSNYYFANNKVYYNEIVASKIIDPQFATKQIENVFSLGNHIFYINHNIVFCYKNGIKQSIKADPLYTNPKSIVFWSKINNQSFVINKNDIYISRFDEKRSLLSLEKIITFPDFNSHGFNSIYFDENSRKLFLGSVTKGLCEIYLLPFYNIKFGKEYDDNIFYAAAAYKNNILLTHKGDIISRNGFLKSFQFSKRSDRYTMQFDHNKNILYKNDHTIYKYYQSKDYKAGDSINFSFAISDFLIEKDLSYVVLINGYKGILTLYKDDSFKEKWKEIHLPKNINTVYREDENHILAGCRDGLYRIDIESGKYINLTKQNDFFVRNISKSSLGGIWIMTLGKGLYIHRKNKIIRILNDPENNLLTTHCILEDRKGFLWFSTNNGLYKIHKAEISKYLRNNKYKLNYYRYNKSEGFATNEFNGGCRPCANQLENDFAFPSLEGMVFFDPIKTKSFYPINGLYVERCLIDQKEMKFFDDQLNLPNQFFRADIFIDIPYHSNSENLLVEAKLSDNDGWQTIGSDGKFSLSSLNPGDYKLEIRILTNDFGKYQYKTIKIYVKPLFHQTPLFWLLMFFISLIPIAFIFRLRTNYLIKRNLKLEKIVEERTEQLSSTVSVLKKTKKSLEKKTVLQKKLIGTISHDITTPVKYLSMTAEMLYSADADDYKLKKQYLESLYKSSLELYNFTEALKEYAEIYENEKTQENFSYSLNEIIEPKIRLFTGIATDKNIKLINKISNDIKLNVGKNILSVIIHNLIDNAIKYSNNGNIELSYNKKNTKEYIQISDEGLGISDEKIAYYNSLQDSQQEEKLILQKYGMGLHLSIQLAQIIGAKIQIIHNIPKGTIIKLIFKNNER